MTNDNPVQDQLRRDPEWWRQVLASHAEHLSGKPGWTLEQIKAEYGVP